MTHVNVQVRLFLMVWWLADVLKIDKAVVKDMLMRGESIVVMPYGAKVVMRRGGWFMFYGYSYSGADVAFLLADFEDWINELGFEAVACGEEPPEYKAYRYVEGHRVARL